MGQTVREGQDEPASAVQSAQAALGRLMRDIEALDGAPSPGPRSAAEAVVDLLSSLDAAQATTDRPRAAAARSFDLLSDLIADVMGRVADFVDSGLLGAEQEAARRRDSDITLCGCPGTRTGTSIWIHQSQHIAVDVSSLRLTDLFAPDGSRLAGAVGTFCRIATAPSDDGSSALWLEISIPDDLPTGTYYGHVLTSASPDTAISVRLRVQP